ncbi:uncharacterized protein LOC106131448 [Amyelois transitella]|uniref:uncharacterized protein LOC106131448 n=1 Tax=Amyelois transitella TaxID=680683 RepID=UPI00298F632B|nr:uncharacterized protein LOC106131448 [Amyelois transitella]
MLATRTLVVLLFVGVAFATPAHVRSRRQLADDDSLQPIEDADGDEQTREKRKFEGVTQAKLGIKNAVLGFVFGKINSLIDAKTRLVDTLDKQNIAINKQYGIEPPQNGLSSLGGIVGQVLQPKLQFIGPKIQAVTSLFGGSSGNGGSSGGQGGGGLGSILSLVTSLSGSSSSNAGAGATVETIDSSEEDDSSIGTTYRRQARATNESPTKVTLIGRTDLERPTRQSDDIPVFDRNKVSLDFPGSLFGPSVSLLIRTTKIIGDVIQNSAVRYQSFLRLFRPLFRGPFEIKGLDPPTTTTTTTTTTTKAPITSDNEIRRR